MTTELASVRVTVELQLDEVEALCWRMELLEWHQRHGLAAPLRTSERSAYEKLRARLASENRDCAAG